VELDNTLLGAGLVSTGIPAPAFSCRPKVFATLLALAVRVAVAAVLTAETVAEKLAEVEPAATVTEAGKLTALLLLARLTASPLPVAAAFSETVQLSVPAPVIEFVAQLRALGVAFEDLRLFTDAPP
jgi:hypothetical protein